MNTQNLTEQSETKTSFLDSWNRDLEVNAKWIIAFLMIFASILSFSFFQRQSLRLDEAQSLYQTSHSPLKILNLIGQDVHVPFYHLLLHFWTSFFGNEVSVARLFSLIFFLLSIPTIYYLGKLAYSSSIGLITATVFTISPFMNWYGNEIRMYSLFVFLSLLNQYFFIKLFRGGTDRSWIGFGVTALLGIYTHYFFFFILFANAIFYFLNRDLFPENALRRFVRTAILLFILFTPWIINVLILGSASNTQPNLPTPDSVSLFNTLSQFIFGFQTDHMNTILVSLWPLTILLGFLALRKGRRVKAETLYFICLFLIPNILAFAISFVVTPVYLTRYLIFTLPPMYFILIWLFAGYSKTMSRVAYTVLIAAMAITLITESVSAATPVKENYREVTEYLEQYASNRDVIAVSAPFTIYPVEYYYKGPLSIETLPIWDRSVNGPVPAFSVEQLPEDIEKIKGEHETLWLLLSYDQGYEEELRIYFDTHFERLQAIEFSPKMNLYQYKLKY